MSGTAEALFCELRNPIHNACRKYAGVFLSNRILLDHVGYKTTGRRMEWFITQDVIS